MTSDAEARLAARGATIEEYDFGRDDEPDVTGVFVITPATHPAINVWLAVRPETPPDDRAGFAEWAESRLDRFFEHGPEPDGWQPRSDGGWQMWARRVEMPPLD